MRSKNDLLDYDDQFFRNIREKEAWKEISSNEELPWSVQLIDKFYKKLDWTELSQNKQVIENVNILEKYKHLVVWDILSTKIICEIRYGREKPEIEWSILEKFDSLLNWDLLSEDTRNIPIDIIDRFKDKWNWKKLIRSREINWSYEHLERFNNYISQCYFDDFHKSSIWEKLVEIEKQIIIGEIFTQSMVLKD